MDVRHKKTILLTALSLLGIGMLTISMNKKNALDTANIYKDNSATPIPTKIADFTEDPLTEERNDISKEEDDEKEDIQTSNTPLLKSKSKQINTLFQEYYLAKASKDVNKIKSLITDEEYTPTVAELELNNGYVEEYQNLVCYLITNNDTKGSVAFVYYETKYISIDTAIPSLDKFYIIPVEKDQYKIYSSEMDEETKSFYQSINNQRDVVELIQKVNEKAIEAVEKDENLKIYLEELRNISSK